MSAVIANAPAAMVAVCASVPVATMARVPVPAPIVALTAMSLPPWELSVTLPLLVVMPVTPPADPTTQDASASLNEKLSPACVSDAATVPTMLLWVMLTDPLLPLTASAAAVTTLACPTVPEEAMVRVPVPAPIVRLMSMLPDVVVFSATLPLFVVMPVTPPAVPTTSVLDVS